MMGSFSARHQDMNKKQHSSLDKAKDRLIEFGHWFRNGKLHDHKTKKPFEFNAYRNHTDNQRRYEALGEIIEEYVYGLLQDHSGGGLEKVYLPFGGSGVKSDSFIFKSHDLHKKDKVLVLMHGSGVVRAGQWSRRLIINESLEAGTMLPYIHFFEECGFGVIVLNTNQNGGYSYGRSSSHNSSPESHFQYVWKNLIEKLEKPVAIVTHSYGGSVVMEAAKTISGFMEQTFAVALTDCWVSDSSRLQSWLQEKVCNWVTSHQPLGTVSHSRGSCKTVSGGTTVHEETPWKAYSDICSFIMDREESMMNKNSKYFALTALHKNLPTVPSSSGVSGTSNNNVVRKRRRSFSSQDQVPAVRERGRSPIRNTNTHEVKTTTLSSQDQVPAVRERGRSPIRNTNTHEVKTTTLSSQHQISAVRERGRSPIRKRNTQEVKTTTNLLPNEKNQSKLPSTPSSNRRSRSYDRNYKSSTPIIDRNNKPLSTIKDTSRDNDKSNVTKQTNDSAMKRWNSSGSINMANQSDFRDRSSTSTVPPLSIVRPLKRIVNSVADYFSTSSTGSYADKLKKNTDNANKRQSDSNKRLQPMRVNHSTLTAPYATSYVSKY